MIEITDAGSVRRLALARPPVNALDEPLLRRLASEVTRAHADGVGGLILTGGGGRYTGGLDLDVLRTGDAAALRGLLAAFFDLLDTLAASPLPLVAAINGGSPAGGAVLALYCDLRLMVDGPFRIGLNEVRVGLYPGALILDVLGNVVGRHRAGRLLSEGSMLSPAEALSVGLVDQVTDAEHLMVGAHAWLTNVLALPQTVFRQTRALVRAPLIERMKTGGPEGRAALLDDLVAHWTEPAARALLVRLTDRGTRR
jgi:enoyl-CoA hydratase/carnithine racemase